MRKTFGGKSSGNGANDRAKTTQRISTSKNTLAVRCQWCLLHEVVLQMTTTDLLKGVMFNAKKSLKRHSHRM